jgi:hypothetical protein
VNIDDLKLFHNCSFTDIGSNMKFSKSESMISEGLLKILPLVQVIPKTTSHIDRKQSDFWEWKKRPVQKKLHECFDFSIIFELFQFV